MKKLIFLSLICIITFGACSNTNDDTPLLDNSLNNDNDEEETDTTSTDTITLKILALGDSYTIGQSVCETCRFPAQLKDSLDDAFTNSDFSLEIIAQTGWTTTNLITAINAQNPSTDYDLVTLLIGVNNQYQNKPFSVYEMEFPQLVNTAIAKAKGDKNKVIVVSIPDYAFTPFGQNSGNPNEISEELNQYNNFAQSYCEANEISYIYITDITRLGLEQPDLVASDGLHPSELAYSKFVERILPLAIEKLQ